MISYVVNAFLGVCAGVDTDATYRTFNNLQVTVVDDLTTTARPYRERSYAMCFVLFCMPTFSDVLGVRSLVLSYGNLVRTY